MSLRSNLRIVCDQSDETASTTYIGLNSSHWCSVQYNGLLCSISFELFTYREEGANSNYWQAHLASAESCDEPPKCLSGNDIPHRSVSWKVRATCTMNPSLSPAHFQQGYLLCCIVISESKFISHVLELWRSSGSAARPLITYTHSVFIVASQAIYGIKEHLHISIPNTTPEPFTSLYTAILITTLQPW